MFKFINKIKNKEYSKDSGFSLLELSVAVGIAAIVGAVGIVATTGFIGSAEDKRDNYVANAERAIAEAESSSLALGETGSTGGTNNSSGEEEAEESEETPAAPSVPTTVLASDITSTGATLTWAAPETGEVGEYIVTLNGDVQGTEPIPNDVFSYDFTNLTVDTYYEAKVFAKSPAGALSEAVRDAFISELKPTVATGGDVTQIIQDSTEKSYIVHRFTSDGTFTLNVTDADPNGEDLKFTIDGVGSSFGGATTQGTRPVAEENITVVVDNGGRVDVAYPQNNQTNDIAFAAINPVPLQATGGSISNVTIDGTKYRIHAFTSTGTSTFSVSSLGNFKSGEVDVLVVAGGGGGMFRATTRSGGGGGGAGGLIYSSNTAVSAQSYGVVVGAGGIGAVPGSNGGNSSFSSITATGGGGGATSDATGNSGGSGGGGGIRAGSGSGISGQGNDGGNGGAYTKSGFGGGGGGGGGAGAPGGIGTGIGSSAAPGDGGDGLYYGDKFGDSFGENGYFSGGGGGDTYFPGRTSNGGIGGGGDGNQPGQANTGGGGGDGRVSTAAASGGSGIVLIRYPLESETSSGGQ